MSAFKKGWYVVYTKPHHEKKITIDLKRVGIESFLPCTKKLRVWSDRRKFADAPIFPSYVFVKLEDFQGYFSSLDITGILYYVRDGDNIAIVKDVIISNLKQIVFDPRSDIEVTSDTISRGEKLIIKDGLFTGLCCEVIQHKGKEKFLVRIELLQRNILLDVPAEYLMPVSQLSL